MILAKSDGTTLEEHIDDCLKVAQELKKNIPDLFDDYQFYDTLILAILFHDFGKLHPEFQNVLLKKKNNWHEQRHEVYSVVFSNKIVLDDSSKKLLQKAIISHHKSFEELREKHNTQKEIEEDFDLIWKSKGFKFHPKDVIANLSQFKPKYLNEMLSYIIRTAEKFQIGIKTKTVKFSEQNNPIDEIVLTHEKFEATSDNFFKHLLFSGILKMCDHYGSAKIDSIPSLESNDLQFWNNLRNPYKHQIECWKSDENKILIAPTGSGKTECALGWLKTSLDKKIGRVFYVLPYTASINAMHKRLCNSIEHCKPIDAKLIGVQHGKIDQYLSQYIENDYDFLKEKSNSFKKMLHPFKITTPFQIMKYFYGVKTFEIGFVNLYGAKIIFDEIHAYDVVTFAQLITVMEFLTEYFRASFFIMTATLPTFQQREIEKVIGKHSLIKPTNEYLLQIIRHKISIYEGNIFSAIEYFDNEIQDAERIILVLNTVSKAQECYAIIKERFPNDKICLIHGRFTAKDRIKNEELAFEENTKFLIGTQAIEVSLDIDYDMMITDPAPLDALLQRFGRVNRKGEKGHSPIYVCDESSGSDRKIYPKEVVAKTIQELKNVDILSESNVQELIDRVYPDWLPEQKKEFEETKTLFKKSLESLQPYSKNKEREEDFYDKFDGIKVLPIELYNEYKSLIEDGKFIEADGLLVSLHKSTYRGLKFHKDGSMIDRDSFAILKNKKIKSESVILAKCKYSSEIGLLTNERCEAISNDDNFM
ncbi:MAG: CRISPR-associated helicase Cas3' [Candidatus Cloacimonetes bacterium]|nr:CRISPR-associated helicase Cas3' [Candidatus Cloacimonadota bacterium]